MSRRHAVTGLVVSVLVLLGLFGLVRLPVGSDNSNAGATSSTSTTLAQAVLVVAGRGCDKPTVATAALKSQGFVDSEFVVGEGQINWSAPAANERGEGAFVTTTPHNAKEVTDQLRADTPEAKAALTALVNQSGASQEQVLDINNWIPAQLKVETSWPGNTQFSEGRAVSAGERKSVAGDVVWLFVHPDKCQQLDDGIPDNGVNDHALLPEQVVTAYRAGCGNPQTALPKPTNPSVPTPPGPPPPGGGKDHTKSPVTGDSNDPCEECRPNVPAPPVVVRSPGTNPPPPPAPPAPPSEPPPPGCGGPGQPPCENPGGYLPPTTVAPPPAPPVTISPEVPVTSP